MVSGAKDINIDPGYNRDTDPDMALSYSPGPDNNMTPFNSSSYPNQSGTSSGTVLGHQHGHRFRPRPWAFTWALIATLAKDINTDPSCSWTMDSNMVFSSSLGCHHEWPLVAVQATQVGMAPLAAWPLDNNVVTLV